MPEGRPPGCLGVPISVLNWNMSYNCFVYIKRLHDSGMEAICHVFPVTELPGHVLRTLFSGVAHQTMLSYTCTEKFILYCNVMIFQSAS